MASNNSERVPDRHLLRSENARPRLSYEPRMAKADLRKTEKAHAWQVNGHAVQRAWELSRLSLKQFAAAVKRDERQVARWMAGIERPQIETVLAVRGLRPYMVIALAEDADGVEVVTEIRVKRA